MKLSEILDNLDELRIDNKDGWGAVPYNQNVNYRGLRVMMKPSMFLKLAHKLETPFSAADIEKHLRSDGAIGAPFLMVAIPQDWFEGDTTLPAEIYGHEGRNRMTAALRVEGDDPVETHLFFGSGLRNRDIKPEIVERLNRDVINQEGGLVNGPWFTLHQNSISSTSLKEDDHDAEDIAKVLKAAANAFKEGFPYDAIEALAFDGIKVDASPALKVLFDANMGRIAKWIAGEVATADIRDLYSVMGSLESQMDEIGITIPNAAISDALQDAYGRIERNLIRQTMDSPADAVTAIQALNNWGMGIMLDDIIDVEDNKDDIIRSMLVDIKKRRVDKVNTVLAMLREIDVDWTELDAIEKSLNAGNVVKESTDGYRGTTLVSMASTGGDEQ